MAQRSFSISEITELYLAYDGGDNGATIQKMSRALTPHKKDAKVGRIISLSFDPNRDDKFDAMMLETAQNFKANKGIKDLKQAFDQVLRTIDIFRCSANGSVKIEPNDYLKEALTRTAVNRVIGKIAPLDKIPLEQIQAIAQGNAAVFRAAVQEATAKGKTRIAAKKKKNGGNNTVDNIAKDLARAREVIVTIAQNIDIIRYQGGNTIDEAFDVIDQGPAILRDGISEDFGVDYELIKDLVKGGIINRDLLELKFS